MRLLHRSKNGTITLTRRLTRDELSEYSYAVLSHTWLRDNEEEVTFQELTAGIAETKPKGFEKIRFCGEQAARDGLEYFWIDTCCINKDNENELTDAIESMFLWYRESARCYVYLTDVSVDEQYALLSTDLWELDFRRSRWFTRGWTLQELLAPKSVEFFSHLGARLGDKISLLQMIHEITCIPIQAFQCDDFGGFTEREILDWSQNRETRRPEDKAYCLLGLLNIKMRPVYGVEADGAFERLKEQLWKRTDQKYLLSRLPTAEAAFNSPRSQHAPTCLPETRRDLLQLIAHWFESTDETCTFWLRGFPGAGKSTIARTIAKTYFDRKKLGGSFFFVKGDRELGNSKLFVTTLAQQLANGFLPAKQHICRAIHEHADLASSPLWLQWERLIIEPLSKIETQSNVTTPTILFVVDALDECGGGNSLGAILRAVATAKQLKSVRLRILITSRLETAFHGSYHNMTVAQQQAFVLHEVSYQDISPDLRRLFVDKLASVRNAAGFDETWPGNTYIDQLIDLCGPMFVWAATACRFIAEGKHRASVQKRLDCLFQKRSSDAGPNQRMDDIYMTILLDFAGDQVTDGEDKGQDALGLLQDILGTVLILQAPLTVASLANLIDRSVDDVDGTLNNLRPVLSISEDESRFVHLHHSTFRDFLIDENRCIDKRFHVDEKRAHGRLGGRCLRLMAQKLKCNICELPSPGTLVKNLDHGRVEQNLPLEVQYACLYWVEHYRQSGICLRDEDEISAFFMKYFLFWLEAINVIGKSAEMGPILRMYHSLLTPDENLRQIPFVKDARRLMFNFQSIIKKAPLQVYCAALTFIPTTNELKSHFKEQRLSLIKKTVLVKADKPRPKDNFNYVSDLAFTPDSRRIASGSNFPAIRYWDVGTLGKIRKYEADARDKMSAIAISPDGKTFAGGSDDFTVMAWDLETGNLRYRFNAHGGWVNSVAFSPDGQLLASASMDGTVALWDASTGNLHQRFDNQSSGVNSVTFSPDGSVVATGSVDDLVRVWDITEQPATLKLAIEGHSGAINSVCFSPSGRQLVSGSDDMTIRLWDTTTGLACLPALEKHTMKVTSVTFSSDNRLIASGSEDKTVRIWNASNGSHLALISEHTSGVNSVLFSPDNKLLATSSFDDEVRLWETASWGKRGKLEDFEEDINSGTLAAQRSYAPASDGSIDPAQTDSGHSKSVKSVVFSPDLQWLATGSDDTTIKLFASPRVQWKLEGHTGGVKRLLFSPNSKLLASSSIDKTVRLWDPSERVTLHVLKGHSRAILGMAFSPDGQMLGTFSADRTVRIWDPNTGQLLATLEDHQDAVKGLAFSPDNSLAVSWSDDATAIIWTLKTWTPVTVLKGHEKSLNSVAFSSDGELLASCAEDMHVRIWNINGDLVANFDCSRRSAAVVAWSPDKKLVAMGCTDSAVRLLSLESMKVKSTLDAGIVIRQMEFSPCGQYIRTNRGTLSITGFRGDNRILPTSGAPPPSSTAPSLFVTREWLRRDMVKVLQFPESFSAAVVATQDSTAVIGHSSGAISFLTIC